MFADGVLFRLILAGILEIVGGILIILGLFTRITAFVLAGFMAAAYFMAHVPQGFFPSKHGRSCHPVQLHLPVACLRRRWPLQR